MYIRKAQAESVIRDKFEHVLKVNDFKISEWLLTIIEDAHTHDFIGFIRLHNSDAEMGQIEVGYMMHPSVHGRGSACEEFSDTRKHV